jgi:hypothetical protein
MDDKKRILVGVPIPKNYMCNAKLIAIIEAWHSLQGVETYYPATGSAEEGQHKIVDFALYAKPKATHILFVDYDVIPRINTLKRLLGHDKDIVSGVYPMYQRNKIQWCLSKEDPFVAMEFEDLPNNLFKAKACCNGVMLVKAEVFENLEKPYWDTLHSDDGTSRTLGADLYFFRKAMKAGYDLWVDPKVKCEHFRTVGLLAMANNYMKGNK